MIDVIVSGMSIIVLRTEPPPGMPGLHTPDSAMSSRRSAAPPGGQHAASGDGRLASLLVYNEL